jgi:hypothetical protein
MAKEENHEEITKKKCSFHQFEIIFRRKMIWPNLKLFIHYKIRVKMILVLDFHIIIKMLNKRNEELFLFSAKVQF